MPNKILAETKFFIAVNDRELFEKLKQNSEEKNIALIVTEIKKRYNQRTVYISGPKMLICKINWALEEKMTKSEFRFRSLFWSIFGKITKKRPKTWGPLVFQLGQTGGYIEIHTDLSNTFFESYVTKIGAQLSEKNA